MTRSFISVTFLALLGGLGADALDPSRPDSKVARNVLESKGEGYCSPSGPIASTNCAHETIESLNTELFPAVHDLVAHTFFKYYKVDLFRQCPFWQDNGGYCMNRACAVEEADESEIPEKWRARALGRVRLSDAEGISSCYFRHDDFCYIEDDASPDGQYIDLTLNPERFTGYAGDSAHDIWRAIYQENCFGLSEASIEAAKSGRGVSRAPAAFGLSPDSERRRHGLAPAETCEEKKLYYRVVSGIHASISVHICAEHLDRATGEWGPNLDCFIWRLATHPERLSNIYVNAVLLLRAISRAAPYFHAYDIGITPPSSRPILGLDSPTDSASGMVDAATRASFDKVLALAERADVAAAFAEDTFFTGPDAPVVMDEFKSHFRNVSRIMDCVGCDKCRLWGKLQVSGFGTALKILFALDDKDLDPRTNPDLLQRSEVVALFNTLHRVAESLDAVQTFRRMYAATQADAAETESRDLKVQDEGEASRRHEVATVGHSWLGTSPAAIGTALLAVLEAVRRSCKGCVGAVACWLGAAGVVRAGKAEL